MSNNSSPTILRVENLNLSFGGTQCLEGVTFDVKQGELLAIIGPNGAGKTSLINCISGFYRPQQGEIYFDGQKITKMPEHKIAKIGIARTFQNIELCTGLTTLANLMAAWHNQLLEVMGAMGICEVRRLRGEVGRSMWFEDLERENFGPIFGERKITGL